MKEKLISIFLAGMIFAYSCNEEYKNNKIEKYKNNKIKNIESKLVVKQENSMGINPPNYKEIILNEKKDIIKKYLDTNTAKIKIFNDTELLKKEIIKEIKKNNHTYRIKYNEEDQANSAPLFNEDYSQINELSLHQNKTIYLMVSALKDSSFVNNIGRIINKDIKNKYSESGGVVNFDEKGKINLRCSISALYYLRDKKNDGDYLLSEEEDSLPKIAYFHLHAPSYNETFFAGPSTADILILEAGLVKSNIVSEFIITSLKKGKFNIDYFGADIEKSKKAKIIDLGNYSYDITGIEE